MSTGGTHGTILLIDAFEDERDLYTHVLAAHGFQVRVCAEPGEAIAAAREDGISAVITRILHPGSDMDGLALTSLLKHEPATSQLPLIVISSLGGQRFRDAAVAAGCDAFLLLPCDPDQLVSEVRRMSARRGGGGGKSPMGHERSREASDSDIRRS